MIGPKKGVTLYEFARGIDHRELKVYQPRKSLGTQLSWGVRFENTAQVKRFIVDLSQEVSHRLQSDSLLGHKLHLLVKKKDEGDEVEAKKVMNPGKVKIITKTTSLPTSTDNPQHIAQEAYKLFMSLDISPLDVRGMGLHIDLSSPSNRLLLIFYFEFPHN